MSMGFAHNFGYVLPFGALPVHDEKGQPVEADNFEEGEIYFAQLPTGQRIACEMTRYNSEDGGAYDSLSDGVYIVFDEDILFDRQPTRILRELEKIGKTPEAANWSVFC